MFIKTNVKKIVLFSGALSVAGVATVLSLSAFRLEESQQAQPKPNIVVILADDLGYADLSIYGSPYVQTPNIDAIGKEGAQFTQGYATAPICSPSRSGLLTGRYQQRYGAEYLVGASASRTLRGNSEGAQKYLSLIQGFGHTVNIDTAALAKAGAQGLPVSETTLAEFTRANGYKTGIIGKWHLGEQDPFLPEARGFDYHYGFYSGSSMYADTADASVVKFRDKKEFIGIIEFTRPYADQVYRSKEKVKPAKYLTDEFADEAVQYIEKNKSNPFFLYVPFNAPHTPFQAPKKFYDQLSAIRDPNKRTYYAMILALDDAVGKITAKLKESGLDKNTLIFFTSDNGGATYTRAANNAPLKGGKLSHFEGGTSVAFLAKWPGKIPAGTKYDKPVSSLDIFPTVAKAIGAPLPTGKKYDGVDLIPFVSGKNTTRPHESLFWRNGYSKAVRKGDWKLYVNEKANTTLLFDLSKDGRSEKLDYSAAKPDKLKELKEELEKWENEVGKPLWPSSLNYRLKVDDEEFYFFPI